MVRAGSLGECIVLSVDGTAEVADVRRIKAQYPVNAEHYVSVPFTQLRPAQKKPREDLNQAAARIIREATERD